MSVAVPRYDNNQAKAFGAQPTGLVVDITIEADGATKTYTIPETATITYAGHLVLSTDKEGILREVEALKAASEEALSQVERHKQMVTNCSQLMEELNPAFAEKRAQDKRIEGIENEVKSLGAVLRDFINEFKSKIMGRLYMVFARVVASASTLTRRVQKSCQPHILHD